MAAAEVFLVGGSKSPLLEAQGFFYNLLWGLHELLDERELC